jgi:hypothetical protein
MNPRELPVHSYRIKFRVLRTGIATDGTVFGGALTEYMLPDQLKDLEVGTIFSMDAKFLPQGDRIRYNEDIFVET